MLIEGWNYDRKKLKTNTTKQNESPNSQTQFWKKA